MFILPINLVAISGQSSCGCIRVLIDLSVSENHVPLQECYALSLVLQAIGLTCEDC